MSNVAIFHKFTMNGRWLEWKNAVETQTKTIEVANTMTTETWSIETQTEEKLCHVTLQKPETAVKKRKRSQPAADWNRKQSQGRLSSWKWMSLWPKTMALTTLQSVDIFIF